MGEHTFGAYADLLQTLGQSGMPHFLEGGQAVNLWADVFLERKPQLAELAPFTSKDCDVCASHQLFQAIAHDHLLPGTLIKSTSPLDGQLGILQLQNPPRVIDFLPSVFGLSKGELERAFRRVIIVSGVCVLDPLYLFKGKCHNFIELPQGGRQDQRHLNMLKHIVPAHFERATERACQNHIAERELISELKLFLAFDKDRAIRQATSRLECKLIDLAPTKLLSACGLAKVEHFIATQIDA